MSDAVLQLKEAVVGQPEIIELYPPRTMSDLLDESFAKECLINQRSPTDNLPQYTSQCQPYLGSVEMIGFPSLGLLAIKAKIDTGAKTSVLGVCEGWTIDSENRVRFWFDYILEGKRVHHGCCYPVKRIARVWACNHHREERPVIQTVCQIGGAEIVADIALALRHNRKHPVLIGCSMLDSLQGIINTSRKYIHHTPSWGEFLGNK